MCRCSCNIVGIFKKRKKMRISVKNGHFPHQIVLALLESLDMIIEFFVIFIVA
jgi:hypothetical protein